MHLGVLLADIEAGGYVSIWKCVLVVLVLLIWARLLTWIDKDAVAAHLPRQGLNLGMLVAGIVAWVLEANDFPIAPAILGVVLGGMLEENFITSMIKSDGNLAAFFERPIAAALAVLTLLVWFVPLGLRLLRGRRAVVPA